MFFGTVSREATQFAYAMTGEPSTDINQNGRPDLGETFTDVNGDGKAQPGELFFDANGDKKLTIGYFERLLNYVHQESRNINPSLRAWIERHVAAENAWGYLRTNLRSIANTGTRATGWMIDTVFSGIQGAYGILSYLVLVPIYTFFLLWNYQGIINTIERYLPGRYRKRIIFIASKINTAVSSFFRGRLIICILKGVITSLGLWLCGIKFSIILGMAAGFLSIVPFLGVIISIIPAVTLVLIDYQGSLSRAAAVIIVFVAVEALEGLIMTPWILGKETGLHPITLILSLLIFGRLFGFFGLLMAIPLTAIAKILAREFLLPHLEELAAESPE